MEYSDVNLYVVRQDYTRKKILNYVDEMFTSNRIQNIHIILNDIQEGTGAYGYGYGYGYGYTNSYGNSNDSNYFEE